MIFDAGWTNSLKGAHLGVVNLPIQKFGSRLLEPTMDLAEIIATKRLEIPMPQVPPLEAKSTIKKSNGETSPSRQFVFFRLREF